MPLQVLLALLQELLLFVNFDQSRQSLFRTTKRIHQKSFRMALLAFTLFFDSLDDFGRGEAFCWPRCVGCIPECERQEFTAPLQDNPSIPVRISFPSSSNCLFCFSRGNLLFQGDVFRGGRRKAFSFPRSVLHEE